MSIDLTTDLSTLFEWCERKGKDFIMSELNGKYYLSTEEMNSLEYNISYEFQGDSLVMQVKAGDYPEFTVRVAFTK